MRPMMAGIPDEGTVQAAAFGTEMTELLDNERMAVRIGGAPRTGGVLRRSAAAAVQDAVARATREALRTGMPDHHDVAHLPSVALLSDMAHRCEECHRVACHHRTVCHRVPPSLLRKAMTHRLVKSLVDSISRATIANRLLLLRTATVLLSHPPEPTPSQTRR
mmetsp:Transcript_92873/g.233487  ORF Transcript_92873/g.233487 Transcript_92873/m.233487 type:complete len:163 (+) Transcript_92873:282-770(+)